METFEEHMQFYREQHSSLGCKITHMFGVPLIAASIPVAIFNWRLGAAMFGGGWVLQFIGHYAFQKNNPVFLEDPKNPWTYCSALVFVGEEWTKLLSGKPLADANATPKTPTPPAPLS
ncbi:MAG TPA: DUF962 domain-containing protein [Candidatus Obscuribacterales bacterium]